MSPPDEEEPYRGLLCSVSKDELFSVVNTIVRRSIRSPTGATMLERRIAALLEEVRRDYSNDPSVTDETVARIAACRIVASLLRDADSLTAHGF